MVEADVPEHAGFDLEFLDIHFFQHFHPGVDFRPAQDTGLGEGLDGGVQLESLEGFRHVRDRMQAAADSFLLPFRAVSVPFEHHLPGCGKEPADDGKDGGTGVFARSGKGFHLGMEFPEAFGHDGVQDKGGAGGIG